MTTRTTNTLTILSILLIIMGAILYSGIFNEPTGKLNIELSGESVNTTECNIIPNDKIKLMINTRNKILIGIHEKVNITLREELSKLGYTDSQIEIFLKENEYISVK